jgi:hypothetical protein
MLTTKDRSEESNDRLSYNYTSAPRITNSDSSNLLTGSNQSRNPNSSSSKNKWKMNVFSTPYKNSSLKAKNSSSEKRERQKPFVVDRDAID